MVKLIQLIEKAKLIGKVELPDNKEVTQKELNSLESVLDNLFKSVKIDVEFTRHFLDRVNDARNKRQITVEELRSLFKKTYDKYRQELSKASPNFQAVLNDIQTDINVPFVIVYDKKNHELDLVNKTIMRKKDFKTSNKKLKV